MVPSARRLGSHSRTNVGMPGCMIAMPNPDTIAAAYSVQTSMAAARAAPPIAAIVIPSVTARVAPTRAINSEPGIAATANIARGNPIRSPTWVSDMCNSSCSCGMTGGMTKSVMRMATPASQRRQSNLTRPPAERPWRPEDIGMKTTRRGESRCLSATPKASNGRRVLAVGACRLA
jgi:hypothetical protein